VVVVVELLELDGVDAGAKKPAPAAAQDTGATAAAAAAAASAAAPAAPAAVQQQLQPPGAAAASLNNAAVARVYAQQLHAYTQAKREAAAQQQALLLTPRLSIGSMFASHSWAVADHLLYTVSYLHKGDPRRWYGVSSGDADAFEVCVCADRCVQCARVHGVPVSVFVW